MVKFVMLLLLAFSVISWYIIFNKFILFKKAKQGSDNFLKAFWSCKNLAEVYKSPESNVACPEATIFRHGYSELKKVSRSKELLDRDEATLEMRMAGLENLKRALRKAESLESYHYGRSLSFLATTGSSTPFIGLFGTVWGIMTSFKEIGMRGSASLAIVAPGISEALVATAAGLAVAIPAVIFYNYYSNLLADMESSMHSFSSDYLNLVERDFIAKI